MGMVLQDQTLALPFFSLNMGFIISLKYLLNLEVITYLKPGGMIS
jgi:hypothetical protein